MSKGWCRLMNSGKLERSNAMKRRRPNPSKNIRNRWKKRIFSRNLETIVVNLQIQMGKTR